MRCKNCHYSLANLTGPPYRCPECGNAFDPNDPSTYDVPTHKKARWIRLVVIAVVTYLVLFAFFAHDALTRQPPQIINNVPGVQLTYAPRSIPSSLGLAAFLALNMWPVVMVVVFLAYGLLVLVSQIRSAISALAAALR